MAEIDALKYKMGNGKWYDLKWNKWIYKNKDEINNYTSKNSTYDSKYICINSTANISGEYYIYLVQFYFEVGGKDC